MKPIRSVCTTRRHGTALFVVLVVLVMLTLAAATFATFMIDERQAAELASQDVQSRLLAESGIEYAAALLENPAAGQNFYHDPATFAAVALAAGSEKQGAGQFTIIAPVEQDLTAGTYRNGLVDESSKLNINQIQAWELEDPLLEREFLMSIPNMTEDIADSILDWVDVDAEPREYGAESDYYETLTPPYSAKNSNCETLDELLKVNGVTFLLLYGEDANRNGLLDPNENDGDRSIPPDNADGILDLGFAAYLTVASKESNVSLGLVNEADVGAEKINLNQSLLTELYDEVEAEFGAELAQFLVAYRMNGSTNILPLDEAVASTGDSQTDNALQQIAKAIVKNAVAGTTPEESVTRGGMDLSGGGPNKFDSLYDLIDAEVEADVNGTSTSFMSPWTSDGANLDQLFDRFTLSSSATIKGRININYARPEILAGIPEMTPELATAIAGSSLIGADGQPLADQIARRYTTAWLLVDGIADQTTMRLLEPYICARGSVYRVQSIGHYANGGPATRLEAIIDSTSLPAKVLSLRDLSGLGTAYPVSEQTGVSGQ